MCWECYKALKEIEQDLQGVLRVVNDLATIHAQTFRPASEGPSEHQGQHDEIDS